MCGSLHSPACGLAGKAARWLGRVRVWVSGRCLGGQGKSLVGTFKKGVHCTQTLHPFTLVVCTVRTLCDFSTLYGVAQNSARFSLSYPHFHLCLLHVLLRTLPLEYDDGRSPNEHHHHLNCRVTNTTVHVTHPQTMGPP